MPARLSMSQRRSNALDGSKHVQNDIRLINPFMDPSSPSSIDKDCPSTPQNRTVLPPITGTGDTFSGDEFDMDSDKENSVCELGVKDAKRPKRSDPRNSSRLWTCSVCGVETSVGDPICGRCSISRHQAGRPSTSIADNAGTATQVDDMVLSQSAANPSAQVPEIRLSPPTALHHEQDMPVTPSPNTMPALSHHPSYKRRRDNPKLAMVQSGRLAPNEAG